MTPGERDLQSRAEALVDSHDDLMTRLVEQRKLHELTQAEVAERMGVSQPTVAAFERYDANPTLSTIRRYALAVGASIEHTVKDVCVDHAPSEFYEIVAPLTLGWQERPPMRVVWSQRERPVMVSIVDD